MTEERRIDPRVSHYFDCRWFGKWGSTDGRLMDLSASGCHIVGRLNAPSVGELVDIEIIGTAEGPLALRGEVVDVQRGVGFGVRFRELDDDARDRIKALMTAAHLSNRRAGQS